MVDGEPRRLFLSLDLDAFYCAVEERENPELVGIPFCVVQKFVVATLSYPARELGLKKLMSTTQVKRQFPDMRLINGESLAKYRAAGKRILDWLRAIVQAPVERLGLEEMRIELTASVIEALDSPELQRMRSCPADELFDNAGDGLVLTWAESGEQFVCNDFYFGYDGISFPAGQEKFEQASRKNNLDAYIAGHLACYIRDRMKLELGYDCSIGIGSTKTYAKMACSLNKPRGVAVLIPGHELEFLKTRPLKAVPGFGSSTVHKLRSELEISDDNPFTVEDLHTKTDLDKFVSFGFKPSLWELSWGRETVEDIEDYQVPSQVSVEDTYAPSQPSKMVGELDKLVASLLTQINTDVISDGAWLATPTHFILSIMPINIGYKRRAKSRPITLDGVRNDPVPEQLKAMERKLKALCRTLLRELCPTDDRIRLLNVCVKFKKIDS